MEVPEEGAAPSSGIGGSSTPGLRRVGGEEYGPVRSSNGVSPEFHRMGRGFRGVVEGLRRMVRAFYGVVFRSYGIAK
jgi:hypothetical protein